jgi:hypothetical protein
MEVHKLAYRKLIEYFDVLRPVLLLDLAVCRVAYDKFLGLTGVVDLDEFDGTIEEILDYFPEYGQQVTPLIRILSQEKIMLGTRVFLLDVLTSLAILVRGDVKEKAQLLFKWYNFSRTNMLSELEHTLLIVRGASCLHRLKLIGLIEITKEDAKHIALSARTVVPKDGSRITFIPGLHLSEFTTWLESGKIGTSIMTAFRILERLSDTLVTLQRKATALYNIVQEKVDHASKQIHIPSAELLRTVENKSPILVLGRCGDELSVCISPSFKLERSPLAYLTIDKLVPMESPLFAIPSGAFERMYSKKSLPHACCHKNYTLTTRAIIPLLVHGSSGLARIDISGLDRRYRYVVSPYTKHEHFRSIQIAPGETTLNRSVCTEVGLIIVNMNLDWTYAIRVL